jgi:hypothetical protein
MFNSIPFEQIIAKRPLSSYPSYILDAIKLISVDKENFNLIGSLSYKIAQFPSDIDVHEDVAACCTKEQAIDFFITNLQHIIRDILSKQYYWLIEFKAGEDKRYDIPVGELNKGNFIIDKSLFDNLPKMYVEGLIDEQDMTTLTELLTVRQPGQIEYEEVKNILREYKVLRWSADEVLQQYKPLRGGISMSLSTALQMQGAVNMELIAIINNKVTDLSNFFLLLYYDLFGNIHTINAPQDSYDHFDEFFIEELKKSIEKLYFSKIEPNYLKVAKRMWTYARFVRDKILVGKLLPLINSDLALAGQIKSELALIIKLAKHTNLVGVPIYVIKNQLETMKIRITNVLEIDEKTEYVIDTTIDNVVNNIFLTAEILIDQLTPVKEILEDIVNHYTWLYLRNVKLAPPPDSLLPLKRTLAK